MNKYEELLEQTGMSEEDLKDIFSCDENDYLEEIPDDFIQNIHLSDEEQNENYSNYDDGELYDSEDFIKEEKPKEEKIIYEIEDEPDIKIEVFDKAPVQDSVKINIQPSVFGRKKDKVDVPTWVYRLGNYEILDIVEFEKYNYKYIKVLDPDGNKTDLYKLFYRHGKDQKWHLCGGLMSKRYHVVKMDEFIEELKSKVDFLEPPILSGCEQFVLSVKGKTVIKDSHIFDENSMKSIFSIVTGCPINKLENIRHGLDLYITNTYNGSKSLRCDFVMKYIADWDGKDIPFTDYFTLTAKSYKIHHSSTIKEISNELTNFKDEINKCINKLKSVKTGLEKYTNKIASKYPAEKKSKFLSIWDGCVGDFRNLYYLLVSASIVLDSDYSLRRHISLKTTIDLIVTEVMKR